MSDFFQGWRRKTGCVLLVMAFIVFIAWMRTQMVYEVVGFVIGGRQHGILAMSGLVSWISMDIDSEPIVDWQSFEESTFAFDSLTMELEALRARPGNTEWAAPFWSIVLALALSSAFLILPSKKRRTDHMSTISD